MRLSRVGALVTRWMPIQPGEGRRVSIALIVYFLVMAGVMLGRNARDSLFLKNFGIAYLPHMYAANALFVVAVSVFYCAYVDRLERLRFLTLSYGGFFLLLAMSRAVLEGHYRWFYPVLYIVVQIVWILSVMVFWTFVGDLFDTRQAKRLFPVVGIGGLLGMIASGLVTKPLVRAMGSTNLFLVWMVAIAAALVLMRVARGGAVAGEEQPGTPAAQRKPESFWSQMREGMLYLNSTPLLRAMAGITLTLWIVFVVVDFQFNRVMNETYPSQDVLTSFLGVFRGWAGFFSLLSQLFLTPLVISRLGLGASILVHPGALVGLTMFMTLAHGYSSVFATKFIDHVLLYTLQESSFQLLYNPVPLDRRGRVRAFIEGYFKPLMTGVAGLLLVVATRWCRPWQISLMAAILAAVWLACALRVKKSYVRALIDNLRGESAVLRVAAAEALARLKDPQSLKILEQTLQTGEPRVVAFAIQFIERFAQPEAQRLILPLLDHPQAVVRATAISALAHLKSTKLKAELPRLLADQNPRVRANAVQGLAEFLDEQNIELLRRMLKDPVARVRANAIVVLANFAGRDFAEETLRVAGEMASAPSASERASAAYALGRLGSPTGFGLLLKLLTETAETVAVRATRALSQLGDPRAVPHLLARLNGYHTLRREIRRAVAELAQRHPEAVLEGIEAALGDPARVSARVDLMKILGRLPHPRVPEILLGQLDREVGKTQASVLRALERQLKLRALPPAATEAIHRYVTLELDQYGSYQRWQRALATDGRPSERLLASSLREESNFVIERVFNGLSLLYGAEMHRIEREINTGSARGRANAFELIETLLPKDFSRKLLGLLEPQMRQKEPPATLGHKLAIEELLKHSKPWLRSCAAYYVGENRLEEFAGAVERLLADESAMVREAALQSYWLLRGEAADERVRAAENDPDPTVRRLAQGILQRKRVPPAR